MVVLYEQQLTRLTFADVSGGSRLKIVTLDYRSKDEMRDTVQSLFNLDSSEKDITNRVLDVVGGNLLDLQELLLRVEKSVFVLPLLLLCYWSFCCQLRC